MGTQNKNRLVMSTPIPVRVFFGSSRFLRIETRMNATTPRASKSTMSQRYASTARIRQIPAPMTTAAIIEFLAVFLLTGMLGISFV